MVSSGQAARRPGGHILKKMTCLKSKPAWSTTFPNENGKHPIRFQGKKTTPDYFVPCGRCIGCRADQSLEWSIRMFHESQMHERSCFVTLTYENAPDKINKQDPQKFIKRLRKEKSVRYFLTGEYGEQTRRPHYHAIIFGEDYLGGAYPISSQLYGNGILERLWSHGQVGISEFTMATAMYVAGYCNKKLGDPDTFSIMSKKPPLGKPWLDQHRDNIRRNELVVIDGQEFPIPKRYIDWLDQEEGYDHLKINRQQKNSNKTDRQLQAKGLHLKAKNKLKGSKL